MVKHRWHYGKNVCLAAVFFRLYLLLCSFLVDRKDVMAPVFCVGAHGADACSITPTEPVQLLPMQHADRVLQVLHHTDQKMAPKLFTPVVRLQVSGTVRSQALHAGLDCSVFHWAEITQNLSSF